MPIRRSQANDLEPLLSFLSLFRGREEQAEVVYHDTFKHPFSGGEGTAWMAWEGDRLSAHIRVSPCNAYYGGQPVKSNWWLDFFALLDEHGAERNQIAGQLAMKLANQKLGHGVLGTPGADSKVFKLYKALRFDFWGTVPFFFLILNGDKVLRELAIFKRKQLLALAARSASHLYLPGKLLEFRHRRRQLPERGCNVTEWDVFPEEAEALWQTLYSQYGLIFDRSVAYLNWRFHSPRYERLGVHVQKKLIGWAVCKTTDKKEDKHFGSLRLGTVVDLLADPNNTAELLQVFSAAVERLRDNGADLIIANLSHRPLSAAARKLGFIQGPSNFHFITRNLPLVSMSECHLTRGDSDGDCNL